MIHHCQPCSEQKIICNGFVVRWFWNALSMLHWSGKLEIFNANADISSLKAHYDFDKYFGVQNRTIITPDQLVFMQCLFKTAPNHNNITVKIENYKRILPIYLYISLVGTGKIKPLSIHYWFYKILENDFVNLRFMAGFFHVAFGTRNY